MAILDDTLAALSAAITADPRGSLLPRVRGGLSRGVAWVERSGRLPDGAWGELRLHHNAAEQRLQAGALVYLPLSRGGRANVVGERSLTYRLAPSEVEADLAEEIIRWLALLAESSRPDGAAEPA